MNKFQWLIAATLALVWSGFCFAQGDAVSGSIAAKAVVVPPELPTADWVMMLITAIGGFKGMTALGIAATIAQLGLKFMSTPLAKLTGKYKLLLLTGFTLISGVTGLMYISEMSLMGALMHSTTLVAFQVFVHQIWRQFVTKQDETPEVED